MSKNTIIGLVVAIVLLIGIGALAASRSSSSSSSSIPVDTAAETSTDTSTSTSTSTAPLPTTEASYTLAQVATHPDAKSCWTAINGGVYDVTSWISQHPGGPEAILSICGKDGSAAFNSQHGGQRRPASELATFRIGALSK